MVRVCCGLVASYCIAAHHAWRWPLQGKFSLALSGFVVQLVTGVQRPVHLISHVLARKTPELLQTEIHAADDTEATKHTPAITFWEVALADEGGTKPWIYQDRLVSVRQDDARTCLHLRTE